MGFLDVFKKIGDVVTDIIPGGDLLKYAGTGWDLLTGGKPGGDMLLSGMTPTFLENGRSPLQRNARDATYYPVQDTTRRSDVPQSTLGPYLDYLVPDPIERAIGTMPSNGNAVAQIPGCQITMQMGMRQVASCPPGYVAVDTDHDGVTDTCMLKEVAKACKLWKPRPKPLLTASDRKTLNRASTVLGRVDNVVKQSNKIRGGARLVKKSASRK